MGREYGGQNTLTFRKLHGFKNIIAWQKASDLSHLVNKAVSKFGPGYYKLADQMRSAAVSVTGNIAEGYCRSSLGDYIRFCQIARGSLGELGSYAQDCERWGLIEGKELQEIIKLYGDASYFLDRLIQSLIKKKQDGTWDKQFWVKEEAVSYDVTSHPSKFPPIPSESPSSSPEFHPIRRHTMDLSNKVTIVTGAGSGIGRGIARMFARLGASVVVADIDLVAAEEVATELEAQGYPALAVEVDVQDAEQVESMLQAALERFGGVDVLVNSAGVGTESPIIEMLEEEWDWVLGVNLKGTFLTTRAVARWWIENGRRGKIINLSSINESVPLAGEAHYCASKGGVMMFTRAAALELAPYGIHVNALAPGMIETALTEEVTLIPELRAAHLKQVPFGRFGQPEDVAKAAAFLASEWSDWITGHSLPVDGGMHLIGEESYLWAIERAMGHESTIPRVPMCWPPGAMPEE